MRFGFCRLTPPLPHALVAHQELMSELLRWAELRHPNVLPFYGMYSFYTVIPKILMVV